MPQGAVWAAALKGDVKRLKTALIHSSTEEVDDNGNTALFAAIQEGSFEAAYILICAGADLTATRSPGAVTLLGEAIACSRTAIVRLLLAHPRMDHRCATYTGGNASGAVVGNTAIHAAVQEGRTPILTLLLRDDRFDVNAVNSQGSTALFAAAMAGQAVAVAKLLAHPRIDVNASNCVGWTALHAAAMSPMSSSDVLTLLLADPRVNVREVDIGGRTALDNALIAGFPDRVSLLEADPRCAR